MNAPRKAKSKTLKSEPEQLDAEQIERQEARRATEHDTQEDVDQGMSTGTHSTTRHGVDWGRSYRSPGAAGQTDKKSEGEKDEEE
jgi:hypothetical protein